MNEGWREILRGWLQRFAKQPRILGVVEKITAAGNEMAVNVDDCQLPAK